VALTDHPAFHPGRAASIELQTTVNNKATWQKVGVMGELHPKWQQSLELSSAPLMFEVELAAVSELNLPSTSELSRFPAVKRDLAIVLKSSVPAGEVLAALKAAAPKLVTEIVLFDDFRPSQERPGGMNLDEKSLAFRLTLENLEQTMQDQEVEKVISGILEQVLVQFSARLR
jgi:phenylalanyl-tRNA synthetase beta chain